MLHKSDMHHYQGEGVDFIFENTHCGLFLEMGLGKTVTALTAAKLLIYEEAEIETAMVIAPKRVAENVWHREIQKWSHLNDMTISIVTGTPKQRKEALRVKADIYTMGRDNTAWLCGQYGGTMLPFDLLIIDESSSFKNHNSVRFKALRRVRASLKRIVLLTGTPAPNGLADLWSQIYLLDAGERLGKYITEFRKNFFYKSYDGFSYDIRGESSEKIIHYAIKDICMSMKAKDYLELPGRIDNEIDIYMPPALIKKYKKFEKEQVLLLFEDQDPDEAISAVNAAALSTKLRQFANGAVYDETKNWHVMHDLKIEALHEIMEAAAGKPVLLAWAFRHDMYRIREAFKKYAPRELKTEKDIDDWNDGKIRLLMMHPASGGHGLNLQAGGHIVVWFGQTWSLEELQQFNARLDRQGQEEVVVVNKLKLVNSIDEKILASQKNKDVKQNGLMDAVKALIKEHIN